MTPYGRAVLVALDRGPMTAREVAFEADLPIALARAYIGYHRKTRPANVHVLGTERSEATGRRVSIYARGPGKQ